MKNYNKFTWIKITMFAALSFNAFSNPTQSNLDCETCAVKKVKENKSVNIQTNSAYLSLFELAILYEINLGGESKKDLSPVIKEESKFPEVMSLQEMINHFGVKVL